MTYWTERHESVSPPTLMNRLLPLVEKFRAVNLLVVGDLMLDRFIWGEVERLSPEAPVPVLRVVSENFSLGGAANVIHNIRTLGGNVTACGIVGQDAAGRRIAAALRRIGARTTGVLSDSAVQTIQKTRIIASPRHQQIVRLDRETPGSLRAATLHKLRRFIAGHAARFDAIVISDYGKGVIHKALLDELESITAKKSIICVIDPKRENYECYRFASLLTPNKAEASEASGITIHNDQTLQAAGAKLLRKWRAKGVLITRGPEGMSLFRPRFAPQHFSTEPRDIFDVTGAGDTVVAVCALALASGASYEDAAVLANLAAGFVGDEVGTVAVAIDKLKRTIEDKT